jgi:hypothetical protein
MITPTRALQAIAVAGLLAAALAENLRGNGSSDEVDGTLATGETDGARILAKKKVVSPPATVTAAYINHPVCYEIAKTWWPSREEDKTRAVLTAMDTECSVFSNEATACNDKSQRPTSSSSGTPYTSAQMNAACTMVGAHDKRCIGNPCNSFNIGTCDLQSTGGQCRWYAKDSLEFAAYQKWRVNNGMDQVAGFGCYRNPCNQPGLDQTIKINECAARSHPGKNGWECTWCGGAKDSKLFGLGMGCQATTATTKAVCAPVSSSAVSRVSVEMAIANNNCQCSTDYTWCKKAVDDARTTFIPRY